MTIHNPVTTHGVNSSGDSEVQLLTVGAAHVQVENWLSPESQYLSFTGGAGAADNAVVYTSPDVTSYNYHIIENESGVAIDVFVSVDGTNYSTAAASVGLVDDVTTGGGVKSITIPDNKVGILRGKFSAIRVIQAAAGSISAGTVRGAHGVE